MNLLLLEPADICDQLATLIDPRRLKHIHETLKLKVGDSIKIGVRDGLKGSAQSQRSRLNVLYSATWF